MSPRNEGTALNVECFFGLGRFSHAGQVPVRNSGHMGGKFADKRRIKNPDTGDYFKLEAP